MLFNPLLLIFETFTMSSNLLPPDCGQEPLREIFELIHQFQALQHLVLKEQQHFLLMKLGIFGINLP